MLRHVLVLVGVCTLTFFVGLGRPAISDSDEGFYAESAREMVESGDWLTPRFNYVPRFEKPVLYYWLAAGTSRIVGVNEWAARFPSAVAGLGLSLLVLFMGRRWYDSTTGLLGGLITATSFGYVTMARQALPDLPLAFFVTLTTWGLLAATLSPPHDRRPSGKTDERRWMIVAAVAAAAGFLTKGPVAIVLPGLVVVPLVAWEYATGRSERRLRGSSVIVAAALFVVLVSPWFIRMASVHGIAYLERFFLAENLDRFATARYNEPRPWWYYLPIVVGGMLPWSPYLALWGRPVGDFLRRRLRPAPVTIRLAWWAAAPLLFYTLSVGKQPRYVLPVLVPLALLLGATLRERLHRPARPDRALAWCSVAAGAVLMLLGGIVARASPLFVEWTPATLIVVAVVVGGSGVAVCVAGVKGRLVPATLATAAIVATLAAHLVVLASPGPSPVERLATMIDAARRGDERYGRHAVFNRNLIFYTRDAFVELPVLRAAEELLREPERVLVVLRASDADTLRARGVSLTRLGEVTYLNTGSLTLRTVLDPSPSRLERVVLAANR